MPPVFDYDIVAQLPAAREQFANALAEAQQSDEGLTIVVVEGESGVGKSHFLAHQMPQTDIASVAKYNSDNDLQAGFLAALEQLLRTAIDAGNLTLDELAVDQALLARFFPSLVPDLQLQGREYSTVAYSIMESNERFHHLVSAIADAVLVQCTCTLVLDDLQWASNNSLELLSSIVDRHQSSNSKWAGTVIALSARPNRLVHQDQWLQEIEKRLPVYWIRLGNLEREDLQDALAVKFKSPRKRREFLDAVGLATSGNPLKIDRFLKSMFASGGLRLDGGYLWADTSVAAQWDGLREDLRSIENESLLTVLEVASCFHNRFHESELLALVGCELQDSFDEAVATGWLTRFSDGELGFAHDQLLQAVHDSLADIDRAVWTSRIGRLRLQAGRVTSALPYINRTLHLLPIAEVETAAQANLTGADLAIAADSPWLALSFCETAARLIEEHQLSAKLAHIELELRAASLLLANQHEQLEQLVNSEVCLSIPTNLRANVIVLYMNSLLGRGNLARCVDVAVDATNDLGVRFPAHCSEAEALQRVQAAAVSLETPSSGLPKSPLVAQLLSVAIPAFHQSRPDLYPVAAATIVECAVGSPASDALPFGVATLGIAHALLGHPQDGYLLGRRAETIAAEPDFSRSAPRTKFAVMYLLEHLVKGLGDGATLALERVAHSARAIGDVDHTCYAWHLQGIYRFHASDELGELRLQLRKASKIIELYGQEHIHNWNLVYEQLTENLVDADYPSALLHGSRFSELRANQETASDLQFRVHLARLLLATVFARRATAIDAARLLKSLAPVVGSQYELVVYNLLASIAYLLGATEETSSSQKQLLLQEGEEYLQEFRSLVALRDPPPEHQLRLVEGCFQLAQGRTDEAIELLSQAIEIADRGKFWMESGLAAETAAGAEHLNATERESFVDRAVESYRRWGANAKVNWLLGNRPGIAHSIPAGETDGMSIVNALVACRDHNQVIHCFGEVVGRLTRADKSTVELLGVWNSIFHSPESFTPRIPISVMRDMKRADAVLDIHDISQFGRLSTDPSLLAGGVRAFLGIGLRVSNELSAVVYCTWKNPRERISAETVRQIEQLAKVAVKLTEEHILRFAMESRVNHRTRQLSTSLAQLRDANSRVRQLEHAIWSNLVVGGLSHELGTPLASAQLVADTLCGVAQQIAAGNAKTDSLDVLVSGTNMIRKNIATISERVANANAHIRAAGSQERIRFSLSDVVVSVVKQLRSADPTNAHFEILVDIPKAIELNGFPGLIGQVIENLVTNSIQHGFKDREHGRVSIAAAPVGEWVHIVVADDGVGLSHSGVFHPFVTTNSSGSGLGLSICRSIVEGPLGGTLWTEKVESGGTKFVIEIPQKAAHQSSMKGYSQ